MKKDKSIQLIIKFFTQMFKQEYFAWCLISNAKEHSSFFGFTKWVTQCGEKTDFYIPDETEIFVQKTFYKVFVARYF